MTTNKVSAAIAERSRDSFRIAVAQGPRLRRPTAGPSGTGSAIDSGCAIMPPGARYRVAPRDRLLHPGLRDDPVVLAVEDEVAHALRHEIEVLGREQERGRRG